MKTSSCQFCGGVESLNLISNYILGDKLATSRREGSTRVATCRRSSRWGSVPDIRRTTSDRFTTLEMQLPHKSVNVSSTITNMKNKLTIFWGS